MMTNEELAAYMYQRTHDQNKRAAANQRLNTALGIVGVLGSVAGAVVGGYSGSQISQASSALVKGIKPTTTPNPAMAGAAAAAPTSADAPKPAPAPGSTTPSSGGGSGGLLAALGIGYLLFA